MNRITVDIVSDIVCPWCYLGKTRFELAIAEVQDELGVDINWRPYQLDPDATAEGADYREHLVAKFGSAERLDEMQGQLVELGREIGLDYHFDKIKVRSNTMDAHRVIHWAQAEGREKQNAVVDRLFVAHFVEGQNIADKQVLTTIAGEAGLDPQVIERLLDGDVDCDTIRSEIGAAQNMGVSGVPFFIFDQQYAVSGAQSVEVFAGALRDIVRAKAEAQQKLN
ncbi:DsbA family oxidoreductase [Agrobacterium sp. ES01]|uniref:DsbA family oxidoreductase n=1 Tax=Agrobacterium sp. ES01 TaxID=3420714 RepID=UPI003D0F2B89